MTQDKTLREQLLEELETVNGKPFDVVDLIMDKIKSVVREMRKPEPSYASKFTPDIDHQYEIGYNQFGNDLLERLGIK